MIALLAWHVLPLALARTVASPDVPLAPKAELGVGNAAHNNPTIIVSPDGELVIENVNPPVRPQHHKIPFSEEDSNLRVAPAEAAQNSGSGQAPRDEGEARKSGPDHLPYEAKPPVQPEVDEPIDESHLRSAGAQPKVVVDASTSRLLPGTKSQDTAPLPTPTALKAARGMMGVGIAALVLVCGFLIARYLTSVAARCAVIEKIEPCVPHRGVSSLLQRNPCPCSRRNADRTLAQLAAAEAKRVSPVPRYRKGHGMTLPLPMPEATSDSSLASSAMGYDIDRSGKLKPVSEEKDTHEEPDREPEHEEESDLGPRLEGATSYVLRVVKARVLGDLKAGKKTSLAWQFHVEGEPPRPSRFNRVRVWDAPVDKVDLDLSDPQIKLSIAVLAAADNPIDEPSQVATATVPASLLLAEGSGNRPKAKSSKKDTMYIHQKTIPLEPGGEIVLEYSIIAFFHWVVP